MPQCHAQSPPSECSPLAPSRLFCTSLGLTSEAPRWSDAKVDFLMWLVARVFTLQSSDDHGGDAPKKAGGTALPNSLGHSLADTGSPAEILQLRENLGKTAGLHMATHHDVEKAMVRRLADKAIRSVCRIGLGRLQCGCNAAAMRLQRGCMGTPSHHQLADSARPPNRGVH